MSYRGRSRIVAAALGASVSMFFAESSQAIDNHGGSPPILYYDPVTQTSTPFMPFGWYVFGPTGDAYINEMHAAGANTVLFSSVPDGIAQINLTLDRLNRIHSLGMKGIVMFRHEIMEGVRANQPSTYATLQQLVMTLKDHPALLGWELGDETPGSSVTLTDIQNVAAVVRSIDPNRQLWQNFHSGFNNTTLELWMQGNSEVLSFDEYAQLTGSPQFSGTDGYLNNVQRFGSLAAARNWAFMQVTQAYGPDLEPSLADKRLPTPAEYRWNAYAPIASGGARGVLNWVYAYASNWYSDPATFTQFRDQAVAPVFAELQTMQHAFETGYQSGSTVMSWTGKGLDDQGLTWNQTFKRFSQLLLFDDVEQVYYFIVTNNATDTRQFQATFSNLPKELTLNAVIPATGEQIALTNLGSGQYRLSDILTNHQAVIYRLHAVVEPGWRYDSSGEWNSAANWWGAVPAGIGSVASFGSIITSAQTVFTNSSVTVSGLIFDNANTYVLGGAGSLHLEVVSGSATINVQSGSHKINLPLTFKSDTNITIAPGATLTIADPAVIKANKTVTNTGNLIIAAPLSIEAGGSLVNGPGLSALQGAANLGAGAKIDVQTGALRIDYAGQSSPLSTVLNQLIGGYNDGAWNGEGIMTSSASATTGLGWSDDGGSILIRYTYNGDANLDAAVDSTDFNRFIAGYGQLAGSIWVEGDFNYDGAVDTLDYNLLAGSFGPEFLVNPVSASIVPEPHALSLSLLGGVALSRASRRLLLVKCKGKQT